MSGGPTATENQSNVLNHLPLLQRNVRDALMRSGQVKPMLGDVVQASTHINALSP
jgi:hypothetical protein